MSADPDLLAQHGAFLERFRAAEAQRAEAEARADEILCSAVGELLQRQAIDRRRAVIASVAFLLTTLIIGALGVRGYRIWSVERMYRAAAAALEAGQWEEARSSLSSIDPDYKDASVLLRETYYRPAHAAFEGGQWDEARSLLHELVGIDSEYQDAQILLRETVYRPLLQAVRRDEWNTAADLVISLRALELGYRGVPDLVASYPELRRVLVDRYAELWHSGEVHQVKLWKAHQYGTHIDFSTDGRLLASAGADGLRLWQMPEGELVRTFEDEGVAMHHIALSPDGTTVLSVAAGQGHVVLWDVESGARLNSLPGECCAAAFSPDGRLVAVSKQLGPGDEAVVVWDVATGATVGTYRNPDYDFRSYEGVAFSPDGRQLAASLPGSIHIWNRDSAELLRRLSRHSRGYGTLRFSPTGDLLAAASASWALLWDVYGGDEVAKLPPLTDYVSGLDFNPRGDLIVYGSPRCGYGPCLRLWSVPRRADVHQFPVAGERFDGVTDVAFSPDGGFVAASDSEGYVYIWSAR